MDTRVGARGLRQLFEGCKMLHKQVDYMCLKWDLPTKNFHGISKGNENEKKTEAKGRFSVRLACSSDKFNFPLERQSRFTPSPPTLPLSPPFQCVWLMASACWRQQSNRNHKGVLPKHKHKRADPPWTKGCPLLIRVHFPWTGQKRMSSGDKNYKAHAIFTPTPMLSLCVHWVHWSVAAAALLQRLSESQYQVG